MSTKETIWQNWTNESAEAVHSVGYDELLEGVIDLWDTDFMLDEQGERYSGYENRTPQDVAEQIWDEVEQEVNTDGN
jgi:uncharacterized Fe-S radical SAM superfamily protein PflX